MNAKDREQQIICELTFVPVRLPETDTAEDIEELAVTLHAAVQEYQPLLTERPANLTGLAEANPRTTFDRIAEMLRIRVITVDWLDSGTLALWLELAAVIAVARSLRSMARAMMLAHELAHERRRNAPHREVLYLTLALLLPRSLLDQLAYGAPITGGALRRICPWPVPLEVCEARAIVLRAAERAA